jgi:hypothetical protein
VIAARGYWTATTKRALADVGFAPAQRRVPALVLPIHGVDGQLRTHQSRPDTPRWGRDGHVIKYETPYQSQMALDVSPLVRPLLGTPQVPLWITEGIKKGDALASQGACAVAVLGVWNWRGRNADGGLTALADWEVIALNERQVYIVFDSDVMTKPQVHAALARLKAFLEARKAHVALVYLPAGAHAAKVGVDDYLVAGHGLDDLLALATLTLHPPPHTGSTPEAHAVDTALVAAAAQGLPYYATPQGLAWVRLTRDGLVSIPLTNFTARIVGDVEEDDGADTRRYFELEATHEGTTRRFAVVAKDFAGMSWALEHLGARAMVLPGATRKDHARAAVQMLSTDVQTRRLYTHLGWRQMGAHWCYLHAGGAIAPPGVTAAVEVDARQALAAYRLVLPATREAAQQAVHASLRLLDVAADAVTVPVYAALWRAALGQADFSLHLTGPTGTGKSELAALAQQHYGAAMTARHLPASWSSTANALEGLAFEAKDVLLVVDDFCPSGAQADIQRAHRDADRLLRAQGNHSGRQRLRPDGSLRVAKPPRGLILSTGEDTPRGQSLRARILIVEVAPDMVRWARLSACQQDAAGGIYSQALAGFIAWLAPRYTEVAQLLPAEVTVLRQAALSSGHRRTPEIVANLALGMQYFLAYTQEIGALSPEACDALWARTWTALGLAGALQQEHQAQEEPVRRFLALLTGALAAGDAHVADARTLGAPLPTPQAWGWRADERHRYDAAGSKAWEPCGRCIGWVQDTRLYLEPEAAFSVAQKLAETQHAPLLLTQQTLWKRMHEQGVLIREPGRGKNLARKTVGDTRRYVVDISIGVLSSETGPIGPIGPEELQSLQNQQNFVGLFPGWPDKNRPTSIEKKRPTATDSSSALLWASFAAASGPVFVPEEAHKNGLQAQQNQEQGPVGPVGPVFPVRGALEISPQNEGGIPLLPATLAEACPQCGARDWQPLATARYCRRCGYRDGPTPQDIVRAR